MILLLGRGLLWFRIKLGESVGSPRDWTIRICVGLPLVIAVTVPSGLVTEEDTRLTSRRQGFQIASGVPVFRAWCYCDCTNSRTTPPFFAQSPAMPEWHHTLLLQFAAVWCMSLC